MAGDGRGGGAPVEGQEVPDRPTPVEVVAEDSTRGGPEGDQRGDDQRLAHGHQAAERVASRCCVVGRMKPVIVLQHAVGEVEAGEQPCQDRRLPWALLLRRRPGLSGCPDGVTVPSEVCTTVCSVVMNSLLRVSSGARS